MTVRISLGVLLSMAWVSFVWADPPIATARPFWQHWWSTSACSPVGCCPNDYMRKPMPVIAPVPRCGGVDDYCRKPLPCVPTVPRCGMPDDYCRKALPWLLCPPWSPFLQCGPSADCCNVGGQHR